MVRFLILSVLILQMAVGKIELAFGEDSKFVEPTAREVVQPQATLDDVTEHGRVLFGKFCAQCHGPSGVPPKEMIDLFSPPPSDLTRAKYQYGNTVEEIVDSIKLGRGTAMLRFQERLSDTQIRAVAKYVEKLVKR